MPPAACEQRAGACTSLPSQRETYLGEFTAAIDHHLVHTVRTWDGAMFVDKPVRRTSVHADPDLALVAVMVVLICVDSNSRSIRSAAAPCTV